MRNARLFATPPMSKTPASPPEFLRRLWTEAISLKEGEELEIPFAAEEDAVKAQRWVFRERKRSKAQIIEQGARGGEMCDPDEADMWRGLVTKLRDNVLIVRRPIAPKTFILKRADGSTKKVKV